MKIHRVLFLLTGILALVIAGLLGWLSSYMFYESEDHRTKYQEWYDEWNQKESECLDDPSCDLDRFDRKRDLDEKPENGMSELVLSALVGAVSLLLFILGVALSGSTLQKEDT